MFYTEFVGQLATLCKITTDQIFMKILPKEYLWTKQFSLNFGSHADPHCSPSALV